MQRQLRAGVSQPQPRDLPPVLVNQASLEHSRACSSARCSVAPFALHSGVEELGQGPCDPQSLQYLLPEPLQNRCASPARGRAPGDFGQVSSPHGLHFFLCGMRDVNQILSRTLLS